MRILKLGVLAAIAIALMPLPPTHEGSSRSSIEALMESRAVVIAANNTLSDFNQFCQRQPETCTTAKTTLNKLELKAKYAIQLINEWSQDETDHAIRENTTSDEPLVFPADSELPRIAGTDEAPSAESRNTLKIGDMLPPWRGFKTQQEG